MELSKILYCVDCDSCASQLNCEKINPFIPGSGSSNPDLVIVFDSPVDYSEMTRYNLGDQSDKILQDNLKDKYDNIYVTFSTKCVYKDKDTDMYRRVDDTIIDNCREALLKELSQFKDGTVIMPMGNYALRSLIPNHSGIMSEAGKVRELVIEDKTYRVLPNIHPASIKYSDNLRTTLYNVFVKFLRGDLHIYEDDDNKKVCMLEPDQAIKFMDECIELYNDKAIEYIVHDLETTGLTFWEHEIIMMGLAHTADPRGFSIPITVQNHMPFDDWPYEVSKVDLSISERDILMIKKKSRELLSTIPVVGHNWKFDAKMSCYHDYMILDDFKSHNDTMFLYAVLVGRQWSGDSIGLKEAVMKMFNLEKSWDWEIDEFLKKFKRVQDRNYGNIPTSILQKYCGLDVYWTRELHELLVPMIQKNDCQFIVDRLNVATKMYTEAELKGIEIDWDMHELINDMSENSLNTTLQKIKSDKNVISLMKSRLASDLDNVHRIRKEMEEGIGTRRRPKSDDYYINLYKNGSYFNPNSAIDKREVLFSSSYYNCEVQGKTDAGEPSTNKESIGKIISKYYDNSDLIKLCELFLEYSKFGKIKSTYIDGVPSIIDPESKRAHYEFNIVGTVTGRLCLSGETEIETARGRRRIDSIPIGEQITILSMDENGNQKWCNAIGLGCTRIENEVMEITLDNGEKVICSVDHPFMLTDGTYKRADEITEYDDLMEIKSNPNLDFS